MELLGTPKSRRIRKESNVEIYFRNCRVECTCAVDDLDLGR